MFGSQGGDATVDAAALIAAIGYLNAKGGGTIRCMPGRTYLFSRLGGSTAVQISAPLRIDLNGATWKRPNGVMNDNHHRMIIVRLVADGASLDVFGGTIDANYTNNEKPPETATFAWEQSTSFYVLTADNVTIPWVKFYDLVLLDREVFDHLRTNPNTGATIELLHCQNIRSHTEHYPRRADIIWYRGIKKVVIEDCPFLHAIETEFTANEDLPDTTINITNVHVGRLDMGHSHGEVKNAFFKNVLVTEKIDSMTQRVHFDACVIKFGDTASFYRPRFVNAVDTTFLLGSAGWSHHNKPPWPVTMDETYTRCTFRLADDEDAPEEDVYAIRLPVVNSDDVDDFRFRFEDCEFDLADFDRLMNCQGAIVELINNTYRWKGDIGLRLHNSSTRSLKATVINKAGGFEGPGAGSLYLDNLSSLSGDEYLRLGGTWLESDKHITMGSGVPTPANLFNDRTVIAAADPDVGLAGDILKLQPVPTSGAVMKLCPVSSSSATWATIASIPE